MTERQLKILLVEDEYIIARDIKKILEDNGYFVASVVDNGKDAISLSFVLKPDLILMDIMLKGRINGIDAAEVIHRSSRTPIIFLSALSDDESFLSAQLTKPYAYLTKPFQRADLLAKIGNLFKTA